MKGVTVSIDRIVIDFTDVYWDFFNEFHKRICHFYGVRMKVWERGFQYRIKINTGEHFLHISYRLVFAAKTRKNTLRIEAYPKSLVYFRQWLEQIRDYANQVLVVRCDVAFDIPVPMNNRVCKILCVNPQPFSNFPFSHSERGVHPKANALLFFQKPGKDWILATFMINMVTNTKKGRMTKLCRLKV